MVVPFKMQLSDSNNASLRSPEPKGWRDRCTFTQKHWTSACSVYCRLRLYPWLWYFSLSLSNLSLADPSPFVLADPSPEWSWIYILHQSFKLGDQDALIPWSKQSCWHIQPSPTTRFVFHSSSNWLTERRRMSYGETRKRATSLNLLVVVDCRPTWQVQLH